MEQALEDFEKLMAAVGYMTQAEVILEDAIRALYPLIVHNEPKERQTSGQMLQDIAKKVRKSETYAGVKEIIEEVINVVNQRNDVVHNLLFINMDSKRVIQHRAGENGRYGARDVNEVYKDLWFCRKRLDEVIDVYARASSSVCSDKRLVKPSAYPPFVGCV